MKPEPVFRGPVMYFHYLNQVPTDGTVYDVHTVCMHEVHTVCKYCVCTFRTYGMCTVSVLFVHTRMYYVKKCALEGELHKA